MLLQFVSGPGEFLGHPEPPRWWSNSQALHRTTAAIPRSSRDLWPSGHSPCERKPGAHVFTHRGWAVVLVKICQDQCLSISVPMGFWFLTMSTTLWNGWAQIVFHQWLIWLRHLNNHHVQSYVHHRLLIVSMANKMADMSSPGSFTPFYAISMVNLA